MSTTVFFLFLISWFHRKHVSQFSWNFLLFLEFYFSFIDVNLIIILITCYDRLMLLCFITYLHIRIILFTLDSFYPKMGRVCRMIIYTQLVSPIRLKSGINQTLMLSVVNQGIILYTDWVYAFSNAVYTRSTDDTGKVIYTF